MIAAMPVFVPPNIGAPAARLGGATRSAASGEIPNIEVLAPQETGLTLREQLVLHWYLATATDAPIETLPRRGSSATESLRASILESPQPAWVADFRCCSAESTF